MKKQYILLFTLMLFLLLSCKEQIVEEKEVENNFIEISKEQFLSEKMSIGTSQNISMEEKISFTGKIVSILNGGVAKVSAPIEGIVKKINIQIAQDVVTNEVIIEIGGNALIDLQQEFAVSAAKINQLKANFERAKELFEAKINTENEFLLAESDYKSELANYTALKVKLQNIGLNILNIENGKYASTYLLKTPINGHISQINCIEGQFITTETEIAEIIDIEKIELQLALFETDYSKISKGQIAVFKSMNESEQNTYAVINRIGSKLNINSNTFACYATIDTENTISYAINQLVNGGVIIATDSVYAIPHTALFSSENKNYIISLEGEDDNGYRFKKVAVKIGKSDKENIEVIDLLKDQKVLLDGAYNIGM